MLARETRLRDLCENLRVLCGKSHDPAAHCEYGKNWTTKSTKAFAKSTKRGQNV